MNKNLKFIVVVISITLISISAINNVMAQKNYNEEVTVVASYEPTLADAEKLNKNPEIIDTIINQTKLIYSYRTKQYANIFFKPEPIKAAKMQPEALTKLYKHYARLGMGNYTTPYFEYFFNTTRNKNTSFTAHARHLSSSGNIGNFSYSGNSTNELDLGFKKFTPNHTWKTNLDVSNNSLHWYGFVPADYNVTFLKDRFKQNLFNIGVGGTVYSNFTDSTKMQHLLGIKFNHLADRFKTQETNFALNGQLKKNINWLDMKKAQTLTLDLNIDIDSYEDSLTTALPGIVQIMPKYKTRLDILEFTLGLNASAQVDTVSEAHFYPMAELSLPFARNMYEIYLGATGGLEKNNFRSLTSENPFLVSTPNIGFSNIKTNYYFGFKGNVSSRFSFNTSLSLKSISNMPLFVNDFDTLRFALNSNRFKVIYDNADVLTLHATFYYNLAEKIRIMLKGNYYNYTLAHEEKPWHCQPYDVTLGVDYNIQNKIIFKANLMYLGASYAKIWETPTKPVSTTTKEIIDANLQIEYRYSKIWSAFVSLNNIAGSEYTRWYNYPSYRFQIMGGLTLSVK